MRADLATPWYEAILGAVERAIAIPFHVGCSILVALAVCARNAIPFLLALLAHARVDALAVGLTRRGLSPWKVEAVIAAIALPTLAVAVAWSLIAERRSYRTGA